MPVYGTPVENPTPPSEVSCSTQATKQPKTSEVFGCPVKARRKAVSFTQGQSATLDWTLVDDDGNPVNLTSCGSFDPDDSATGEVRLKTREAVTFPGCNFDTQLNMAGVVTDAAAGQTRFAVGTTGTRYAGVFLAQVEVYGSSGSLVFVNQFYMVVNRSLSGDASQLGTCGVPSLAEIRLEMRDSDPSDNPLLESVQFDVAEIAAAIEKPVLYWNETPPPIDRRFTTATFPYRYHWLKAVVSQLYLTAAHFYRRNRLPSSAGGVQVDDLGKAEEYQAIGQQMWAEYQDFVLKTKVRFNAEAAIQSSASPYIYGGW